MLFRKQEIGGYADTANPPSLADYSYWRELLSSPFLSPLDRSRFDDQRFIPRLDLPGLLT